MAGENINVDMVIRLANELSETHEREDAGEIEVAEDGAGAGEGDEDVGWYQYPDGTEDEQEINQEEEMTDETKGTIDTTPSFDLVLIL